MTQSATSFTIGDLQKAAPSRVDFAARSEGALAGRCLLDALEYLRKQPETADAAFMPVANAHAARLTAIALNLDGGEGIEIQDRTQHWIGREYEKLVASQKDAIPAYGDDFWDWAAVIECFLEMYFHSVHPRPSELLHEVRAFAAAVDAKLGEKGDGNLQTGVEGDWYGPATAAAAYRVLSRRVDLVSEAVFDSLKKQALEPIDGQGNYRGVAVPEVQQIWHTAQVVTQFPRQATRQWGQVRALLPAVDRFESPYGAYALARVIQGAAAIGDQETRKIAVQKIYQLEDRKKTLGEGLVSGKVKASLNVFEGLWPGLSKSDKLAMRTMVLRLNRAQKTEPAPAYERLSQVTARANVSDLDRRASEPKR